MKQNLYNLFKLKKNIKFDLEKVKIMRNVLFLNKDLRDQLNLIQDKNKEQYKTWIIFSVIIPFATYIISIVVTFLISGLKDWEKIVNNGSLTIISLGLLTSGVPYLLEKLDKHNTGIDLIRSRAMAFAMVLIFLSSAWSIFQTTSLALFSSCPFINTLQNITVLIIGIAIFAYSFCVSLNMFLLQKKAVEETTVFQDIVEEGKNKHGKEW